MIICTGKTPCFRSVVFDFDYTLADSSVGAIECVDYAFRKMNLPPASAEAVRATIGLSISASYNRLAGERAGDRVEEFERLFIERADQVMLPNTRLLDSVSPAVETLLAGGIRLGIVSTKFRYRIQQILRREGLEQVFEVIIGAEDVAAQKPDPRGLLGAIDKLGVAPAEVLFVGDSVTDAETADRASVSFVAVLSGVTPRNAFRDHEPLAILEDLSLLPALVLKGRGVEVTAT